MKLNCTNKPQIDDSVSQFSVDFTFPAS